MPSVCRSFLTCICVSVYIFDYYRSVELRDTTCIAYYMILTFYCSAGLRESRLRRGDCGHAGGGAAAGHDAADAPAEPGPRAASEPGADELAPGCHPACPLVRGERVAFQHQGELLQRLGEEGGRLDETDCAVDQTI